jgi:hypothetical protein
MAARTNTSVGVGVVITLLAVATLGLFITTGIFYAKQREAILARADAEKTTKEFLSDTDRNDAVVMRLKEDATKARKTVMRLMLEERKEIMAKATGSERDTLQAVSDLVDKEKAASLAAAIRDRNSKVESLEKQLADANTARIRAQEDQLNESKRVKAIEDSQQATVKALTDDVNKTKQETDTLREDVNKAKAFMDKRVEDIRADYAQRESLLKSEIDKLQAQSAVDRQRIIAYENQIKGQRFAGQTEYALVDGQIVGTSAVDGTVTLSIGRRQRVVLGMPFNVYAQGSTIKVDEQTGQYPVGKATVEVIRVDDQSCIARVLRQQKGNPVINGDVVANPIFDPAKKYKFLVYGNFDPSRTGNASVFGANEVKAWIKDWGGELLDEVAGDIDFLVLGERPQLPPQPPTSAPLEVINFYINQQKMAQRYDELLRQATETSIPLLNENRLRTLIGR